MNKGLAIFASLGLAGLVLALGKSGDNVIGPPKPVVKVDSPPGEKQEVVDLVVIRSVTGSSAAELAKAGTTAHYVVDPDVIVQAMNEDQYKRTPVAIYIDVLDSSQAVSEAVAWLIARASRRWGFPLSRLDSATMTQIERPRGVLSEDPDFPIKYALEESRKYL